MVVLGFVMIYKGHNKNIIAFIIFIYVILRTIDPSKIVIVRVEGRGVRVVYLVSHFTEVTHSCTLSSET